MWGLFVKKHAEAIVPFNDLSVLYLHPIDDGIEKEEWIEENENSIHSLIIYYPKPKSKFKYFYKFLQLYLKGFKHINNQRKIDLIHVHILTRMGLLAYISFIFYSIPFVITEHWSRYLPTVKVYSGCLRKKLTEMIVRSSKLVMPVTINLKNAMISQGLGGSDYEVVPNVVDDLFFNSSIEKPTHSEKRVLHVSTFEDKSKNISGIIDAIHILNKDRSDFKMIFVGYGDDFERMKAKAIQLQLEDRIAFTGLLEKEALVQEYEKATFMLINSNYENMPVVINEAFACGLPVLSTNVGGISEHLTKERGRLIEPGQPHQLLEQINWMLDHYQEFDSSQIRKYAQERFSMEAVGRQISAVYKKVLKD